MRDTVLIEEMTWIEVKEAIQAGKHRVIVMLGAMEQHGPHLEGVPRVVENRGSSAPVW